MHKCEVGQPWFTTPDLLSGARFLHVHPAQTTNLFLLPDLYCVVLGAMLRRKTAGPEESLLPQKTTQQPFTAT